MTYLQVAVLGMWFHLYLILDLYSRKIVGWEVHATDDSAHAEHFVRRTALAERIATMSAKPVLHGDNGSRHSAFKQPAVDCRIRQPDAQSDAFHLEGISPPGASAS